MATPEREQTVSFPADVVPDSTHTDQQRTIDYPAAHTALPLPTLAGYELLRELGRGGMGVVYQAQHLNLKRLVALKMLLGGAHSTERDRIRFRIEAEAVARMQHPNIVQIHEVGEVDGHLYCALEFVGGGSLAGKLRGQPLAVAYAVPLVEQLAKAVQFAHRRNVIHRDLKPANVLLELDGTPKIADFGLARQTDQDSGETKDGAVMGTPSYMAPEQAFGFTHDAGPAADVYALGAILYECLTGRPPFKGQTVGETLDQVRHQDPVPLTRLQPTVPRDLETICLKCLRKEPEQRYSSAQELADDLARFRTHQPITARPVSSAERLRLWWRRNPALGLLGASFVALFVLVSLGGIVAAVQFSILAGQRAKALGDVNAANAELARTNGELETEKNNVANALKDRTTALGKAQRALAMSTQAEALVAWHNRNPNLARDRLQTIDADARCWEWGYLQRSFAPTALFVNEGVNYSHVAWSPDGQTLATATLEGRVLLVDPRNGTVRHTIDAHTSPLLGLVFTPDGSSIISASHRDVRVWSPTGQAVRGWSVPAETFSAFAQSPLGSLVALGTRDGQIRLWNPQTGGEGKAIPNSFDMPVRVQALAFDPTGRTVARATSNDVVSLVAIADGTSIDMPQRHDILALAFNPEGTQLAAGGGLALLLWDVASQRLLRELPLYASQPEGYRHIVTSIEFRGDGRRLVTACGGYALTTFPGPGPDNSVRLWAPDTGRLLHSFRSTHGPVQMVRYRPDGQELAGATIEFASVKPTGTIHRWDCRGDGEHRLWSGLTVRVSALAFNSDGSRMVTVGGTPLLVPDSGEIVVWDTATHQPIVKQTHPDVVNRVAVAPDGQTFAFATENGQLVIRDMRTGETRKTIAQAHAQIITSLNYHAADRLVSTGNDGLIRIWNPTTGTTTAERKLTQPREPLPIAVCHPTNGAIVAGFQVFIGDHEEEVVVWQPDQQAAPMLFARVVGGSAALAISPDGRLLASINNAGELTMWDFATRQRLLQFKAHQTGGLSLNFSPDSRRLASMAHDRSVRLWDTETGRETLQVDATRCGGDTLRFSPDGTRLVAAGGGAMDLLVFGGEVFSWETTRPTITPHDTSWHVRHLLQTNLGSEGACYHGRYALKDPVPPMVVPALLLAHFDVLDRATANNDPRLAELQRECAAIIDTLAPVHSAIPAARWSVINHYLAPRWQMKSPSEARAEHETKLTVANHAIRATGPNPDHNVYTLTFDADKLATGLQLTMNIDPESKHLGRAENGNFDLCEIEVYALGDDPQKPVRVPIRKAWASYNASAKDHYTKKEMRPEFAIDGDPKTTWNSWPAIGEAQQFAVEWEPPATLPKQWQVRLRFEGPYARHSLCNVGVAWTHQTRPLAR